MLEFCVLSSGSKANCLYVRSGDTRVLVDCGLSAKEAVRRLGEIDVDPLDLRAVVVTHEHNDHVAGIPVFLRKCRAPIYANAGTFLASRHLAEVSNADRNVFETGATFSIGELTFESFSITHDAADPVAFRISNGTSALGIVTDLGQVTNLVRERALDLDALILESNHDPLLLRESPYPWELKQRIAGRSGHLSNESAGELLEHIGNGTGRRPKVVIAAHISEKSNDPILALDVLKECWSRTSAPEPEFKAASVHSPTTLYRL